MRWAMSDSTLPTSQKASLTDAVGRLQYVGGNGSRKKGQSGSQKLVLAVEKKAT